MAQAAKTAANHFNELMQEGRQAMAMGQVNEAHRLWKQAATLDPYSEQVWLALLEVLESDADRRVCLQNIVQINPMNVQARRQLNKIEARVQRIAELEIQELAATEVEKRRKRGLVTRALLIGLAIGLSGTLFGILASILIYGG